MNRVSQILEEKGHDVLRIEAEASVFEAVKQMVAANVASLLVSEGGEITGSSLSGITSPRDGRGTHRRGDLRSRDHVLTADRCHAADIDRRMHGTDDRRRIRHLPVVDDEGEVIGIVSIGDVVKFKSKQQSFEIKFLHEYIGAK